MSNMPQSLDPAKPNNHQFTNKLYDLSEVDLDLRMAQQNGGVPGTDLSNGKKSSDSAGLVDNDYLSEDNDFLDNFNPLYGRTDNPKSSKA